jgi:exopolysaccharide production protein ExoY
MGTIYLTERNALSIVEASLETAGAETAGVAHPSADVYILRSAPPYLTSAIKRAFSFRYAIVKRGLDIILSSILLILLFPLGLAIALLIALSSPGPIFYCEERFGRFRVPFRIVKFRTMYTARSRPKVLNFDTARRNHPDTGRFKKRNPDPRITRVGRVLRRMSLDELPQLWNVLRGDMSLVGPRPIIAAERPLYGSCLPYYDLFCPGITGLWQVSGRSDVGYDQRVLFDREYASRWSCLLDLTILARTIGAVITMRGAY